MSTILNYIKHDANGTPIYPELLLAKAGGTKIGMIKYYNTDFMFTHYMNRADEISFSVNKYIDGELNPMWNEIKDFRLIYINDYADDTHYDPWFRISVELDEDTETVKSVTGEHLQEEELGQINLYDIDINTEDDIARDDYTRPTVFYDPDHTEASLLHRVLKDKAPHYTIYHVDDSLKNIQRSFSFNKKSIQDILQKEIAEEIDCLFIFGEHDSDDGINIHRTISAYDLEDYCKDCGTRGAFPNGVCTKCGSTNIVPGYGEDTDIYVSVENLADSINYENNVDDVKNCFRLRAGDDLMTATVRNINPNGTNYLYYFSDAMRNEMSDELRQKLEQYDTDYNAYLTTNSMSVVPDSAIEAYNTLITKYKTLNTDLVELDKPIVGYSNLTKSIYEANDFYAYLKTTLSPGGSTTTDTTAAEQASKLTSETLDPVGCSYDPSIISKATADASIKTLCGIYVDTAKYMVKVVSSTYTAPTWTGVLSVTKYTDETDTANTDTITVTFSNADADYIKQLIEKSVSAYDANKLGAVALFEKDDDDFKAELKKYSLDNLSIFQSACTAAKNVMIQQGLADTDNPLYSEMYLPYYNKGEYIEEEMSLRESELAVIKRDSEEDDKGVLDYMNDQRKAIATALDIRTYLGDDALWEEFCSFRREDEYSNDNYISDNLTDAELVSKAEEFFEKATKEIIKSATLQNSISGQLKDFMIMPEFKGIKKYFQTGNWIHLNVNDNVYELRITSIKISYKNLNSITVNFSNVVNELGTLNDIQSILSQAKSMATTYASTANQAEKGATARRQINDVVANGLELTKTKIVDSANNQDIVQDSHGVLYREYLPIEDDYDDKQVRVINRGIYMTDDNWKTAKAAVGDFVYKDPATGEEKEGYGVIADKLIGNLILSKDVGIYNEDNSVTINEEGIKITADKSNADNSNIFYISRKNTDGTVTELMYLDKDGNLVLDGTLLLGASSGKTVDDVSSTVVTEYAQSDSPTTAPTTGWQETSPTWTEGTYIWARTKATSVGGDVTYGTPVCITGNTGATGSDGATGKGIESIDIYYLLTSTTDAPGIIWMDAQNGMSDPIFSSGTAQIESYGNDSQTLSVVAHEEDNPVDRTDYQVNITATAKGDQMAGFSLSTKIASEQSKRIVLRVIAKIPVGRTLQYYNLDIGDGATGQWLTDNSGTGEYREYINEFICGSEGTFSEQGIGYWYIDGGDDPTTDNPLVINIAEIDWWDITNTDGWSQTPTIPTDTKRFLWSYQVITYNDGSVEQTEPVMISGNGKDISNITTQYYLSSSDVELKDGEWLYEQPEWKTGYYMWTRQEITWSYGTTSITDPTIDEAINVAQSNKEHITTLNDELYGENGSINTLTTATTKNTANITSIINQISPYSSYIKIAPGNPPDVPPSLVLYNKNGQKITEARLTDTALEFMNGNVTTASISNQRLYAPTSEITNLFFYTGDVSGMVGFVQRSNGHLSLKKMR